MSSNNKYRYCWIRLNHGENMSKSNIAKIEEAILKFTKPDYMVMQKKS